jgi:hypothetical protein
MEEYSQIVCVVVLHALFTADSKLVFEKSKLHALEARRRGKEVSERM